MKISIFLSYPQPFMRKQEEFIDKVKGYLYERGYEPRTLGVTDYDIELPLAATRRLLLECNGVLIISFRRTYVECAIARPKSDISDRSYVIKDRWLTSPWCHIEASMAYQFGLPVLIYRESGVVAEGVLEKGVSEFMVQDFNLDESIDEFLRSRQWRENVSKWENHVRAVVEYKGKSPRMY